MGASVLIISYHFYPDRAVGAKRASELARDLVRAGYRVVVLTADHGGAGGADDGPLVSRIDGVEVVPIPSPRKLVPRLLALMPKRRSRQAGVAASATGAAAEAPREGLLSRLKRWYHSLEWLVDDKKLWSWRAARRAAQLGARGRFCCVITSGPPMTAHVAALAARPLLRAPWVMDMRDPWTDDSAWLSHIHSALSLRVNRWLERRCISSADQILTTTPGLAESLRQRYPRRAERIEVVYNGFDEALDGLPAAPAERLQLLYAGSLYYNRNPFPLLQAIARLLEDPAVERERVGFRLVGQCEDWQGRALQPWLLEHGIADRVEILPPVKPDQVKHLLAEANVLVNFAQGQPRQIPAKMFEYIASGREMLLLTEQDSDSARLARHAQAGLVVDPADEAALASALRELYQRHAAGEGGYRAVRERINEFSRQQQNERLLALVAQHAGERLTAEIRS